MRKKIRRHNKKAKQVTLELNFINNNFNSTTKCNK